MVTHLEARDQTEGARTALALPAECPSLRLDPGDKDGFKAALSRLQENSGRKSEHQIDVFQWIDLSNQHQQFAGSHNRVWEKARHMIDTLLATCLGSEDRYFWRNDTQIWILRPAGTPGGFADATIRFPRAIAQKLFGMAGGRNLAEMSGYEVAFSRAGDPFASLEDLERFVALYAQWRDDCALKEALGRERDLDLRFRPTLNFRKGLVGVYEAVPRYRFADGHNELAESFGCDRDSHLTGNLDLWVLRQVCSELEQRGLEIRSAVATPIHTTTILRSRFREPYLTRCRLLPKRLRKRLIFRLMDVPTGIPQSKLRDLATYLRPFCLAMVLDQSHGWVAPDTLRNTGIDILGLDVAAFCSKVEAAQAIREVAGRGHEAKLRTCVTNLDDVHLSHIAVRSGVDYFNGKALMPMVTKPSRVVRLNPNA